MTASRALLITTCLLALSGCKMFGGDENEPLEFCSFELKPLADLNPNDRGEPTPVDVRIYPLFTPNAFTQASFEDLWTKEDEVLGASMAQKPEIVSLEPSDEAKKGTFKKLKMFGGHYVGLMALYQGQSGDGLEERKICVEAKIADGGRFEFTKHRIVLVGGGALSDASTEGGAESTTDGGEGDGASEGAGEGESSGGESSSDGAGEQGSSE